MGLTDLVNVDVDVNVKLNLSGPLIRVSPSHESKPSNGFTLMHGELHSEYSLQPSETLSNCRNHSSHSGEKCLLKLSAPNKSPARGLFLLNHPPLLFEPCKVSFTGICGVSWPVECGLCV